MKMSDGSMKTMPYIQPMLGDIELPLVQKLDVDGNQALAEHAVPALEGDLVQGLGRMASRITLRGILTGTEAGKGLKDLREKFRAAEPVDFVADLATATKVNQVLIEEMVVRELAGKPERFEYAFSLREYIAPTPPSTEEPQEPVVPQPDTPEPVVPDPPDVRIDEGLGTLIVEVIVEGRPDYDYSNAAVTVEGQQEDGCLLSRTLNNRTENIWTEQDFPSGEYSVTASADSQAMSGSKETVVRSGETAQETVTLHAAPSNIAKTFIVHFPMDNAFVEPGLCQVLQRVASYAGSNPGEKMIVLGHTDLVGSEEYNQKLSERRARSVYAFLTFGRDDNARLEAVDEWDTLRRTAAQWQRDVQDNWGTREYQFMLQDLDYYKGNIDGNHGPKTKAAVSDFQQNHGLTPTGIMDDLTWRKLIEEYLGLYSLAVPENQFFQNAGNGCNGGILKWLGAGEQDPVKNTQDAWRPNRRTDLLFVQGERIPCEVPKPRTFDKPDLGGPWCLGPDLNNSPSEAGIKRQDFLSRNGEEPNKWLVQPAEPGNTIVSGTIVKDTNDGPPFAYAKYVLIAPDGEYLHTDANGQPDLGERPQGERRGEPIANQADENGNYGYPEETPVGTYILEIQDIDDPRLARWRDDEEYEARSSVIFQPLNQSTSEAQQTTQTNQLAEAEKDSVPSKSPNVVVQSGPVASPPVKPIISISGSPVVVVKKSYTNPARREITLKAEPPFRGKGVFSFYSPSDAVIFFDRKVDGNQVVIPASGKEYSGKQLEGSGVKLFAEGIRPSLSNYDIMLQLVLKPGTPDERADNKTLTAISLNLNLCQASEDLSSIHDCLPEPTSSDDKWQKGGMVYLNPNQSKDNAVLKAIIEPYFPCLLVLRNVMINGNTIGGLDNKAEFLTGSRAVINGNPITFSPFQPYAIFRTRGKNLSKASRDTGFQLGFQSLTTGPVDPNFDGDRVSATVIPIPIIQLESSIVIVEKPHTRPERRKVTLKTSGKSSRSGTFTVSENPDKVKIYEDKTTDKEISIPAALTKEQLTKGVDWFIAGVQSSSAADDIELTLSLDPNPSNSMPDAPPATARITAVELTLDICASRKDATTPPEALPSPTGSSPPQGSATDKWFGGRFVHLQDIPGKSHDRALLRVHKPKPSDFKGDWRLVLHRVAISGNEIDSFAQSKKLELFVDEKSSVGENAELKADDNDLMIMPNDFGPETDSVKEYWVEGAEVSDNLQDTGFQLGLDGIDKDGDRISMTVCTFELDVQGAYQLGGTGSTTFVTTTDPAQVVTVMANFSPSTSSITQNLVIWEGGIEDPKNPLHRLVSRIDAQPTTVLAHFGGSTRQVEIFVVRLILDVDADRDGVVSDNEIGHGTWEYGANEKGAVILCNCDADSCTQTSLSKPIDYGDDIVDGVEDVKDLAPLIVRRTGQLPANISLILSVSDRDKIRVFDQLSVSATPIIGPGINSEAQISNTTTADVELGMEATSYLVQLPDANHDDTINTITLTLVLREGSKEIAKDIAKVMVAPWIMPSHLNPTEEIYIVRLNNTDSAKFIDEIKNNLPQAANILLKEADGTKYKEDIWMQDTMEVGYSQIPKRQMPVILNSLRNGGLHPFPRNELLGPDYGFISIIGASYTRVGASYTRVNDFDSFGNLEVSPPVTAGGKSYRFGRIYFGGTERLSLEAKNSKTGKVTRIYDKFNQNVEAFLGCQKVQSPFSIDTSWLLVGHVDEAVTFIPAKAQKGFKMLIASTEEAKNILQKSNGNEVLQFCNRTVNSILNDKQLWEDSKVCQAKLNAIQSTMQTNLGLSVDDIIKIPSIFRHEVDTPDSKPQFDAWMPGMVNMLVVTGNIFDLHRLVIPKPFGLPSPDGFEADVKARLVPLGYQPNQIVFVNDFVLYHKNLGEIHCGTQSKRAPYPTPWWEQTDFA